MLRDLLVVVLPGLTRRKARSLLLMLGPLLGVAATVGAVGLAQSAKGQLQAALDSLGTNLLVVEALEGLGAPSDAPRLPIEASQRVARVSSVESVAAVERLTRVSASASPVDAGTASRPLTVMTANEPLLEVLRLSVAHGRFLSRLDEQTAVPAVVVGAAVARDLGIGDQRPRSLVLAGRPFGVVGVLDPSPLAPELEQVVLITPQAARERLGHSELGPTQLFVRVTDGTERETADLLPIAVTYGGPGNPIVRVPSDLLAAEAQVDTTLRMVVLAMGLLALVIGGVGIANVLTMGVLQRAHEIGVRRAMGYTRSIIGLQFVMEAFVVGSAGALAGASLAGVFVAAVSAQQRWVLVLDPTLVAATVGCAVVISTCAGLYPAWRAARLEPLEALRL